MAKKVSAYADDLLIYFNGKKSLNRITGILDLFHGISGLSVNKTKSYLFLYGGFKKPVKCPYPVIENEPIPYYGFLIKKEGIVNQYDVKLDEIERILTFLSRIHFSLIGKKAMIHSYALSLLSHQLYFVPMEDKQRIRLSKILNDFLWNGKIKHPKLDVLALPKEKGGIGLQNIELRIKASTIAITFRTLYEGGTNKKIIKDIMNLETNSMKQPYFLRKALTEVRPMEQIVTLPKNERKDMKKVKYVYQLLQEDLEMVKLTDNVKKKVLESNLNSKKIYQMIWNLKTRPKIKEFAYLRHFNYLGVNYSERCPFCENKMERDSHIFSRCEKLNKIYEKKEKDVSVQTNYQKNIIIEFGIWKVYNAILYDEEYKEIFKRKYEEKIEETIKEEAEKNYVKF